MTKGPKRIAENDRPRATQPLLRYGVAVGCMLVAFGVRYLLTPWLGEELPFTLFISAALVAAWYGGASAGILALLLGLFLADHFFLASAHSSATGRLQFLYILRYVFTASLGIFLIEVLHQNRRKLEREVAKREQSEAALSEAHKQLSQRAQELDFRVAERTAQLENTVQSLQNLLYYIAHNFRAPLRAVRGYTDVLKQEYASKLDAKAVDYCDRMSDAAERMDMLIHDLLEYGRLGHVQLALTTVSWARVVDRVLFHSAQEIESKAADVQAVGPLPEVRANGEILERVLANLLDNALKFARTGVSPRVRFRAERRGPVVRLWVEDNGMGIEPRYHERIFGVFETLYSQKEYDGTGIGLALAKEGIERMGGRVGVESEPGAGSRFWIDLPAASPEEQQSPVPAHNTGFSFSDLRARNQEVELIKQA